MFNVKSLKKFTVISASALMLLSVGGGAVASHTNVHADSALNKIEAESAKDTDADEAQDSQKEAEFDKASGGESAQKLNKQMSKFDKKSATARKANVKPIKVATKAHKHSVRKHANKHAKISRKSARKVAKGKRTVKHLKRQINRKNKAKKHVRKHAKRQSLQQQINGLKREMRSLQNQINRLEAGYRK